MVSRLPLLCAALCVGLFGGCSKGKNKPAKKADKSKLTAGMGSSRPGAGLSPRPAASRPGDGAGPAAADRGVPEAALVIGSGGSVHFLALHPDKPWLVSVVGGKDCKLRVFDQRTQEMRLERTLPAGCTGTPPHTGMALSLRPDGKSYFWKANHRTHVVRHSAKKPTSYHEPDLLGARGVTWIQVLSDTQHLQLNNGRLLSVVDTASGTERGKISLSGAAVELAYVDGHVAAQLKGGRVEIIAVAPSAAPQAATMGAPAMGAPAMGAPTMGAPAMAAPTMGAPAMGAPAPTMGAPVRPRPPAGRPAARPSTFAPGASPLASAVLRRIRQFEAGQSRLVGACGPRALLFVTKKQAVMRALDGRAMRTADAEVSLRTARCSPLGDQVLVAPLSGKVLLHFSKDSQWKRQSLSYAEGPAHSLVFGPKGRWFGAATPQSGLVRFWWAKTHKPAGMLAADVVSYQDLALRPDGLEIATLTTDRIQLYSLPLGKQHAKWRHELLLMKGRIKNPIEDVEKDMSPHAIAYHPTGKELLIAMRRSIFRVAPGKAGQLLAKITFAHSDRCLTRVQNAEARIGRSCADIEFAPHWDAPVCKRFNGHDFCLDDQRKKFMACVEKVRGMVGRADPHIQTLRLFDGKHLLASLRGKFDSGCSQGDFRGMLVKLNVTTGKSSPLDTEAAGSVHAFAVHPNRKHVALALGSSRRVSVRNFTDEMREHRFGLRRVTTVGFCADGKHLAYAAPRRGSLVVSDFTSGKRVARRRMSSPATLAWHPKAPDVLAVGSSKGRITLLRLEGKRLKVIRRLYGHSQHVTHLLWNAAGTALVSGSRDGTVRVWPRPVK